MSSFQKCTELSGSTSVLVENFGILNPIIQPEMTNFSLTMLKREQIYLGAHSIRIHFSKMGTKYLEVIFFQSKKLQSNIRQRKNLYHSQKNCINPTLSVHLCQATTLCGQMFKHALYTKYDFIFKGFPSLLFSSKHSHHPEPILHNRLEF